MDKDFKDNPGPPGISGAPGAPGSPGISVDGEALARMTPQQIADMMVRLHQTTVHRLQQLEKSKMGSEKDQIEIFTDQNICIERVGNKVNLWIDVDEVRKSMMPITPPPPLTVDRYEDCNGGAEPDIYLSAFIADLGFGFDTVVELDGNGICYKLVELNVIHDLTPYTNKLVFDSCAGCHGLSESASASESDSGTHPTDPDPGVPFDGEVVVDVQCAGDGTGDLIVTYVNLTTKARFTRRKTGCCCDSGTTPGDYGDSGDTLDKWQDCAETGVFIYLNPSVYDNGPVDDPTIQLDGAGVCYKIEQRGITGNLETQATTINYRRSCHDENCDRCTALCVAGAGTSAVNGTYLYDAALDFWVHELGVGVGVIHYDDAETTPRWEIQGAVSSQAYLNSAPKSSCPPLSGWTVEDGDAPAPTLTLGECATSGTCPADVPTGAIQIQGYFDNGAAGSFFGIVQYDPGSGCVDGTSVTNSPLWDGKMNRYVGACVWDDAGTLKLYVTATSAGETLTISVNGAGAAVTLESDVDGDYWMFLLILAGSPFGTRSIIYKKTTGQTPAGTYTLETNAGAINHTDPAVSACNALPATLVIAYQ